MNSQIKILVTAFDPFGDDPVNSALETLHHLPDTLDRIELIKFEIPTVFGKSSKAVTQAIQAHNPDAVLMLGMAGGRPAITPERVAINLDDARIWDNEGNQPEGQPIAPEGPAAYFSTLPISRMEEELTLAKIPASISNTAGTFVCNHLMYSVLHYISQKNLPILAGFVHFPYLPEQVVGRANYPSVSLELLVEATKICLRAIALSI